LRTQAAAEVHLSAPKQRAKVGRST